MSLIPSPTTPFNLPLFNSVLASSAARKEDKNEKKTEENGRRKWQMADGKSDEGTSEEENGGDGGVEEEEKEEKEGEKGKGSEKAQEQQKREDGEAQNQLQKQQQQQRQQQHMDIPTIAFQLVQQAMINSRNEAMQQQQQRNRENEKFTMFGPTAPSSSPSAFADGRFTPQRTSNSAKFKKSGSAHPSPVANGRRSANKNAISAAATAALMAPSPLGAHPTIPGALAVAACPAAQLFREDDWSWHRNPAAAIRSGGTNKQTPVWKYFVYNKAENLSRCIVGTCTYQLKGPHTSTLACHLKKHAAEYAEFQRLKTEYTRERMVNGQTSSGSSAGGERSASARSTPFAGHSSSVGILPNGTAVGDGCPSQKSRSPSILSDPFPPQFAQSSNASSPILPSMLNGRFANCVVLEDEPIGRSLLPRGMPTVNKTPNGDNGIFGGGLPQHFHPLGGHPPPHHIAPFPLQHFLIAAVAMAGQNNGMQQRFTSPPPQFDCAIVPQMGKMPKHTDQMTTNGTGDGVGQGQQQKHCQNDEALANHMQKRDGTAEGGGKGAICGGGTGGNLLDILNLLSKRAEAAASKEKGQKEEGETRGGREREEEKKTVKRKCTVKRESDEQQPQGRQWTEDGQRKEIVEGREEEDETATDEGQTQTHLNHSVEHILKDGEEKEEEELAKKRAKTEEKTEERETKGMEEREKEETEEIQVEKGDDCANGEESADFRLDPMDRFALFLGTAFPPAALRHLIKENPFLRKFCSSLRADNALTFESVNKLMDTHFARMKDKIRRKLAQIQSSILLLDIRCGLCWRHRQNAEELGNSTEECQCQKGTKAESLVTVTLHSKRTENAPILLAMRRIEEEEEKQQLEKGDGKEREKGDGLLAMANLVEQILSDFFSSPSSFSPGPLLLLFPPSFSLRFPSSIRSIPCLPAIGPRCLQKQLLTMLSRNSQFGQMNEQLAKECSRHPNSDGLSVFPSTSTDFSNESSKEMIRLHEIITEKSHWVGTEEMDEAFSAIQMEKFGTIDGLAQHIGAELSKTANALKLLDNFELAAADGCVKNALVEPLEMFGSVIEGETEWTERSAMLLFNATRRSREEANNGHD
ncbi:hypothetical protein niasHT_036756 [Heterodera trifolii]|uniref:BED-type domain-containing protein n=1 Tax=Heterodera trifolii TaxID=157864 RepID=A0ABD2J6N7_9BILA